MGLFQPGWMNNDSVKAIRAVGKLTDQGELADAAKNAPDWRVRIEALEKLNDQAVLIDISKNDKIEQVRKAAVNKITDEKALADIADNDAGFFVCMEALKRINSQIILLDLASNGKHISVRFEAAAKLIDEKSAQKAYLEIAKKWDNNFQYRQKAIERLSDQAVLLDLAKSKNDIRKEAIKNLSPASLKSLMLFCCDVDTSDPEKERASIALQKDITEALSHKLPTGFSKVFTDFDEYKKVSEKFKYREGERVSLGCSIGSTMSKKYGFDFPPFEG